MKNTQQEWQDYKAKMWPGGIGAVQNKECHQAFMFGALSMVQRLIEIVNTADAYGDDAAAKQLAKLYAEVMEICNSLAINARNRN